MTEFEKRVLEAQLTKTESRIADYFLENINNACFKTVATIALEIGVSDTSIIRFARTLGFNGFSEMQRSLKDDLVKHVGGMDNYKIKKGTARLPSEKGLVSDCLTTAISNLETSFSKIDVEMLESAVQVIQSSEKKYLVAFRSTAGIVSFMYTKLKYLLKNVFLCTHNDAEMFEQLIDIGPNDCMVLFTFPGYSLLVPAAIDFAKKRGAKVILVTDKITTPFAQQADYVFTLSVEPFRYWNSYVAPLAFCDLLIGCLGSATPAQDNERFREFSEALDEYGVR